MQVTRFFMTNEDVFHCDSSEVEVIRNFKEKHKGRIAETCQVTMTKEELQDIPVTSESYDAFRLC